MAGRLVDSDNGSAHQQNLKGLGLRVLIIRAPSNRMVHLRPLVDGSLPTLAAMSPGQLREVRAEQPFSRHTIVPLDQW